MERYEIGDDARLREIAAAAARGDEVLLTVRGTIVAEVTRRDPKPQAARIDLAALRAFWDRHRAARIDDAAALVRTMRTQDDH